MKLIQQSATLVAHTPDPELLIERAGRVCWKSESKMCEGSHSTFIDKVCNTYGHESIAEHASATFHIVCSRDTSHQIVRHRIASYSQESQRYCKYRDDVIFIDKPWDSKYLREAWEDGLKDAEYLYKNLLKDGVKPEDARSVLPNACKTELFATMNFRQWKHFLKLRLSKKAQPAIRELAESILTQLVDIAPTVFGGLK